MNRTTEQTLNECLEVFLDDPGIETTITFVDFGGAADEESVERIKRWNVREPDRCYVAYLVGEHGTLR